MKCQLYNEFYRANIKNRDLIDVHGKTTQEYWSVATRYVNSKISDWIFFGRIPLKDKPIP